jgi:hypothetical protein
MEDCRIRWTTYQKLDLWFDRNQFIALSSSNDNELVSADANQLIVESSIDNNELVVALEIVSGE